MPWKLKARPINGYICSSGPALPTMMLRLGSSMHKCSGVANEAKHFPLRYGPKNAGVSIVLMGRAYGAHLKETQHKLRIFRIRNVAVTMPACNQCVRPMGTKIRILHDFNIKLYWEAFPERLQ